MMHALPVIHSLYSDSSHDNAEIFTTILEGKTFCLEKIASFGAASEPGFWYDQAKPEWVVLVRGRAAIAFEAGEVALCGGDYLLIPAHCKHRVMHTSHDAVWLAVHFETSI